MTINLQGKQGAITAPTYSTNKLFTMFGTVDTITQANGNKQYDVDINYTLYGNEQEMKAMIISACQEHPQLHRIFKDAFYKLKEGGIF